MQERPYKERTVAIGVVEGVTVVGAVVATVVAALQMKDRISSRAAAVIENPVDGVEIGGRYLAISGHITKRRRASAYWVIIQPCDTSAGLNEWWPQRHELSLDDAGHWSVMKGTLGRGGALGETLDSGKMYVVAVAEVTGASKQQFSVACSKGDRIRLSSETRLLRSAKVRRVEQSSDRQGLTRRATTMTPNPTAK